jgi:hypothetical protein
MRTHVKTLYQALMLYATLATGVSDESDVLAWPKFLCHPLAKIEVGRRSGHRKESTD